MYKALVNVLGMTLLASLAACSSVNMETGSDDDLADDGQTDQADNGGNGGAEPNGGAGGSPGLRVDAVLPEPTDAGVTTSDVPMVNPQPLRSAGCGKAGTGTGTYARKTTTIAGATRTYFVRVPQGYDPNQAYPLLFQFHGTGGTAPGNARGVELSAAGTEAIIVSPQGLQGVWTLSAAGVDVQFFDAMYDEIRSSHCINQQRVFAMGFSRGGAMSNLLGCVRGHQIRGIGPLAGWQPAPSSACVGSPSAWYAHGESDGVVPMAQGVRARDGVLQRHSCSSQTVLAMPSPCVSYPGCSGGVKVVWCAISGGHGEVIEYAAPIIWDFFKTL